MRRLKIWLLFASFCVFNFAAKAGENYHLLGSDKWVKVNVEEALYEKPGSPYFFVRVSITNLGKKKIGVDLSDRWKLVYINQWGMDEKNYRSGEVDEERLLESSLDNTVRERLNVGFKHGSLKAIEPGKSLDYYIYFNNGGRKEIEKVHVKDWKYCIVVMDGSLFFSDGNESDLFSLFKKEREREVAVPIPLVWKTVPKDAICLGDS